VLHHTFQTVGEGETALATRIGDPSALPGATEADLTLAFLPAMGTVRVRLSAQGDEGVALNALEAAVVHVRAALGPAVFSEDETPLEAVVGMLLAERGLWIATGERCTGGAVAARLTSVAGASRYVRGAVVAYDNSAKTALLGVSEELLRTHGAVSEPVALAMAAGARHALGADVAVATTGIAGPGGGTAEKPVGTIFLAVDAPAGARAVRHRLTTDREINVGLATMLALDLVRRALA
jgi:nicotinamide-nucleotide amidase